MELIKLVGKLVYTHADRTLQKGRYAGFILLIRESTFCCVEDNIEGKRVLHRMVSPKLYFFPSRSYFELEKELIKSERDLGVSE